MTTNSNRTASNTGTKTARRSAPASRGGFLESLEPRKLLTSAPIGGSILFVDHDVLDAGGSINALPGTEVVFLDGNRDGIEQVSAALANRRGLDSIQFASHGASGRFGLGASQLDGLTLHDLAGTIGGWGDALRDDGDILLWGCDVASSTAGRAFVRDLASITRADVAASINSTGNKFAGSDWVLEFRLGGVPAQLASPFMPSYQYSLGVPNDSPIIGGTTSFQSVTDIDTITPFTGVSVTDTENDTLAISVTLDDAAKGVFTSASLTSSGFTSAGGGVYTFSGSPTAAAAALAQLVFDPTDNRVAPSATELTTFTIAADDGLSSAASDNATSVFSVSVNDAPVIAGVSTLVAIADTGTVQPFPNVTIADADNPAQTLSVSVALDTAAKGVFTSASLTASGFVDATGGVYTFSGTAAAAQAAIRQLQFDPTNNRVAPGLTEITNFTISVDDGVATAVTNNQTNVYSVSVNDAPTIGSASAGQAVNDNATVSLFSAVTIGDVDSPAQTVSVTVTLDSAAKGVFTSASLMASGFADATGGVYTFSGTAAAAQTAIRLLAFDPTNDRVAVGMTETTTFTISVSDGLASAQTNNTTTVVSTSINDAPTIGGASAGQAVNENATIMPFSAVTIADADPSQTVNVSVSLDTAAKGVFTSASLTASGFVDATGGVYTYSGSAAAAQTAIRLLAFDPTDNRVDTGMTETTTFTISVDDGVAAAATNNTTTAISTAVNDAPAIGGVSAGQTVNDSATVSPFSAVTIVDADTPADTLTITVTLDTAAKGIFTGASLIASGFNDDGGGVYSFMGNATAAQAAIRQLVFNPADNRVNPGMTETTTFTISSDDGVASPVTNNTTTVVSSSVNDAPTIGGTSAGQAVNDNATVSLFSAVTIADADASQSVTVTVTLDTAAKGEFTSASLSASGFTDATGGVYTFTGTAAAAQTAIRLLSFDPANNRVAVGMMETTTFTISVDDGVAAAATDNTTTVITTSVNDASVIGGTSAGQAVNDNSTITPFSSVTIADSDPSQTFTVTVTLDDADKGVFTSASLTSSGFSAAGSGVYTLTGVSASAAQTAIRLLDFDPTINHVGVGMTETTTFTISVFDGVTAIISDNTTSVISTSVNDAPAIGGASAGQAVLDTGTVTPFSSVTIVDGDTGQTVAVSVTLDTAAKGVFTAASLTASGFADAGSGVYTFTGTAAAAQSAIRLLSFDPTNNRVAPGATETTTFTISVDDGVAAATTNNTTTVVTSGVNDLSTIGGAVASQGVDDTATVQPFTAVTISDQDPGQTLTVTVTLDTAAKGVFTGASLTASGFTDAGGGAYTFSGSASAAQTAIRLLDFNPADNRVNPGSTETTTFTIGVADGFGSASNNTTTVVSTSTNDAPTIGGTSAGQAVNDSATVSLFSAVTIADADASQSLTVTVTLDNAAKGVFTSASLTASGFVDSTGGVYTFTGTAAAAQTAIRLLSFNPTNDRAAVGMTETTTFTIEINDVMPGAATDNTTTVVSTSMNDAPTIGGSSAGQAVDDTATVMPFATITVTDPDNPAQTQTVSITLDTAAKGVFTSASLTASGFASAGGGVYTFTGTAADAQSGMRQLVFNPTDNRVDLGMTETTTFTISVDDGVAAAATDNTTTVISTSVNDAAVIGGVVVGQAVNDNATLEPFSAVTIADADSPAQMVSVAVVISNQNVGVFTAASLTASGFAFDSNIGDAIVYTLVGVSPAAAQTAVRLLDFDPVANRVAPGMTETATFTISVHDGVVTASDSTTTAIITSINDTPSIGGTSAGQTVNENSTITPFAATTIADADSAQTLAVTVTLDTAAKGAFTSASLTASGFTSAGAGVYTFSGNAGAAQTAIRLLAFDPADNRVDTGMTETTTFTISVDDGVAAAATDNTTTVVSTAVNVAPSIGGVVTGQTVNDNATASPFSTITIADSDTPAQTLTVSVTIDTAAKGTFTPASLTASGFVDATGGMYTFSGNAGAAQAAIRQLVFQPAENRVAVGSTETSTFTISVDDGVAAASTDNATTVISTSMNDASVIGGAVAAQAVNDNATLLPFASLTISDPDPSQTFTVTVILDDADKGVFTSASLTASGFMDLGGGTYQFSSTAAASQAAIRQLVYNPTNDRVAVGMTETTTFLVRVFDGVTAIIDNNATTVVSTSVNDAPTIGGSVAGQTVDETSNVNPFASMTFADTDPSDMVTVNVLLDNADKGVFTPASLTASGFSENSGVYSFMGSASDAQTAIRLLAFDPANNRVDTGMTETTTFFVTVDDGTATALDNTTTVVSTAVNEAPSIGGSVGGQTTNDTANISPFSGITFADTDSPAQTLTVSVTIDQADKGVFTSASLSASGFSDDGGGVYSFSGTAAAAQTAIRLLAFNPTNNRVTVGATETSTFTISVDDGVATAVTNNATTVASTSVNDAPTLGGSVGGQAVNDDATRSPFASFTIADVDVSQPVTVTITLDSAAKGAFTSGSLTTSGFSDNTGGVYSFTGSAADAQAAIRQLVFNPTDNRVAPGMTETTTFTVSVNDGIASAVTDNSSTVISTSINDTPVVSGSVANQTVNENQTISPFTGIVFADADPGQTYNVGVFIYDLTDGTFTPESLTASGFVPASAPDNAWSLTGVTIAQAQAAVRMLVFNPADNVSAVGATNLTNFTIALYDLIITGADVTTSVLSSGVNDLTILGGTVAGQATSDTATLSPFSSFTIADPDPGQTFSVSVTLDAAVKGVFTSDSLTASGFISAGSGVYTYSGTASAAQTAIRQLVFNPADYRVVPGMTETTTFTVSVNDSIGAPATTNATTVVSTGTNAAPTLSTINILTGSTARTDHTISYNTLFTASNATDANTSQTILFRIEDIQNGTLTKNGNPITEGVTTIGPSESLVWTSDGSASGTTSAFTVRAFDGTTASGSAIAVRLTVTAIAPNTAAQDAPVSASSNASGTVSIVTRNDAGDTILLQQPNGGGDWTRINLSEAGVPDVTGGTASFVDAATGRGQVSVVTDAGLFLLTDDGSGNWTSRNLTEELGGPMIVGELANLTTTDGINVVGGRTAGGDLVIYNQTGGSDWTARNLYDALRNQSEPTPTFTSPIITYVTSWNGLNFGGLDEDGNIWTVWTGGGIGEWHATNLSAITGAPTLVGGVTAYTTPWGGINLAGVDTNGDLSITWWVPQFGGDWVNSNFTQEFGGPALRPGSVASYVTNWNALNIAGVTEEGEIVQYWWVPPSSPDQDFWRVTSLTNDLDSGLRRPSGGTLTGFATQDSRLNLVGSSEDGHIVRLWWSPTTNWALEDLTALT